MMQAAQALIAPSGNTVVHQAGCIADGNHQSTLGPGSRLESIQGKNRREEMGRNEYTAMGVAV